MSPTRTLLTAALLAVVAASVPGQRQFDELAKHVLPADSDDSTAVALGDVDGDGDLDMVFGNGGQNRLYFNDGRGVYTDVTAARMPPDNDPTNAVALCDVDGDGDLDLVFGNGVNWSTGQQDRLYLNDGTGTFTDATAARMPPDGIHTRAVALGDVDGDGDPDLVLANEGVVSEKNRLYLNDGTGTFTDATAARMPVVWGPTTGEPWSYAVALGDVDGDDDLDIVFGNGRTNIQVGGCGVAQENWLYLNDGTGRFTDVSTTHLPRDSDFTNAVALADVDGDSDLDIVFGSGFGTVRGYPCPGHNRLYLNDGTGTYTDATAARLPEIAGSDAVALDDVDGDADLDIVFGSFGLNRLYLNDGTGTYTNVTAGRMPSHQQLTLSVALGDVDGDGDLDLVAGNGARNSPQQNRLYLNLLRQVDSPRAVTVGGTYQLDAYARYGPPRLQDVAFIFLSAGTASIPLPPFGTFGVDPTVLVALPPLVIPQPAGVNSVSFAVPNQPRLVGASVFAQALLTQNPAPAFLTNVTADVIAPAP